MSNIIETNYKDEMEQSYIDYAMSVIVSRALPDVRDGLKPVHRRILYAMNDLNVKHDTPHKKSARIVGDVLGKYHPHGDSSVYNAMVRLSQDFNTNHPLVDGQGNFGSIDGDGAAAMRYCLTGDSFISTKNGLVQIKNIVPDSKENSDTDISIEIESFDKTNHASKFFNSGKHPVKEIKTSFGYSLNGSYNHPVLLFRVDNGKPEIYWSTLDKLSLGDVVVLQNDCYFDNNSLSYELSWLKDRLKLAHVEYTNKDKSYLTISNDDPIESKKIHLYLLKYGITAFFVDHEHIMIPLYDTKNIYSIYNNNIVEYNSEVNNEINSIYNGLTEDNKLNRAHNRTFENSLLYAMNTIKTSKEDKYMDILEQIMYGRFLDVITSISDKDDELVYSIKVDSNCHSFVANGFINHNTEARLTGLSDEMLDRLNKNTVTYSDNFDQSLREPDVLPSKFCNILINGSEGIAVGMATSIPPHNLNEVNNACKEYLKNRSISNAMASRLITGPDFPTGGVIINKSDLKNIYKTGNGTVKVRAKLEVEKLNGGRHNIVVTEIPYTFAGNKERLLENLINLIEKKELNEVSDIRDESSRDGIRIVLETKRGVDPEMLTHKLFSISKLEDTAKMNLLAIVDGEPKVLSLSEIITNYMEFSIKTYESEIKFELKNYTERKEILDGLVKASNSIDLIISIIRNSKDIKSAKKILMGLELPEKSIKNKQLILDIKSLNFSDRQADAILRMQLQRLVGLELNKLQEELKVVINNIKECEALLSDNSKLNKLISDDLDKIKNLYGRNRLTKLLDVDVVEYEEEEIIEDLYLLMDKFNYLKVIDSNSYSRADTDDYRVTKVKSNDSVYLFTSDNRSIQLKMADMNISKMSDRGTPLDNNMEIFAYGSYEDLKDKELLFITKLGRVKRVKFEEFITNRRELVLSKTRKNDETIDVIILDKDNQEVLLETENKRFIRFDLDEIPTQGRIAMGVIGINLNEGDIVVAGSVSGLSNEPKRKRGGKGWIIADSI